MGAGLWDASAKGSSLGFAPARVSEGDSGTSLMGRLCIDLPERNEVLVFC